MPEAEKKSQTEVGESEDELDPIRTDRNWYFFHTVSRPKDTTAFRRSLILCYRAAPITGLREAEREDLLGPRGSAGLGAAQSARRTAGQEL